jgi:three-Cys-motif partner protein
LSATGWVETYRASAQDSQLMALTNVSPLAPDATGPWAFLKLAFLWNYAFYTYTPIIEKRYSNMCYVDLFAGSGIDFFKDSSGNSQFMLGSPLLMATLGSGHPFKTCFFFESRPERAKALEQRLAALKASGNLTCKNYELYADCNIDIKHLVGELKKLDRCHFLLFVDPYSTEINWETLEKLLRLEYPSFDMIFNFQPFGVNRKSYDAKTILQYFGDMSEEVTKRRDYRKLFKDRDDKTLEFLEDCYIQKLREFPNMVRTIRTVRIKSGTGSYYYDLIYTTRKKVAPWVRDIDLLKPTLEGLTGQDISIMADPAFRSLEDLAD